MEKMKITAGLGALENLPVLAKAGADEVFAGFLPVNWLERFGNIMPVNRREVLFYNIQLDCMDDMKLLKIMADDLGVEVSVTFNSICYTPRQYPLLAEMMNDLAAVGLDSWIIADPALILFLNHCGIRGKIHLSGETGAFNAEAIRLFETMGITRYIFPRKVSPETMKQCVQTAPDREFEAFALNEMCHFSGACCSSVHCDELDHMCRLPYRAAGPDCKAHTAEDDAGTSGFGDGGCALCALQRLQQAGVTHLKIVGRGAHIGLLERDIRLMRRALDMGELSPELLRREILNDCCSGRCYYPL